MVILIEERARLLLENKSRYVGNKKHFTRGGGRGAPAGCRPSPGSYPRFGNLNEGGSRAALLAGIIRMMFPAVIGNHF